MARRRVPVVATTAGHRYVLTTYLYSMEVYRAEETFHSSLHPAGSGWGGAAVPADVRFVLELQDIDPSNPATLVAPATVLYDGVIANAPGFCTYALVNASNMQCSIAYTYAAHISLAEVRTALPSSSYETQLVGSLSDGAAVRDCEFDFAGFLSAVCAAVEHADRGELSRVRAGGGGSSEQRERGELAEWSRQRSAGSCASGEDSERADTGGLRECGAGDSG